MTTARNSPMMCWQMMTHLTIRDILRNEPLDLEEIDVPYVSHLILGVRRGRQGPRLLVGMTVGNCVREIGASVGNRPFGQNSKMPGPSYGLPAAACHRGSLLSADPSSMCHPKVCYAKRNRYATWIPVVKARDSHLGSLRNPRWVEAFVYLFRKCHPGERWFRWHDSGDLQGVWHLRNICLVAEALPNVRFWLPTHEPNMVRMYRTVHGPEPKNLTIRVSADRLRELADWNGLTSTVHDDYGHPITVPGRVSYECRAHDRGNACGPCRACWSPNAHNVSYPRTGKNGAVRQGRGVRSTQLRIFP